MRVVRGIGNVFIVLGLTLLLFVGYELIGTSIITNHHQSALAEVFDNEILKPPLPTVSASASAIPKPKVKIKYKGPQPIARMTIPRLGSNWSRIVVQGTSLYALAYGPGHYTRTPLPGHPGTVGVACHRTGWGSPCINLDHMRPGDMIYLDTADGRYTYRVTAIRQVEAKDSWVLNGDPNSKALYKFALTTCTPKYTSLHRLVIWADQVSPKAGATPPPVPK
jgi:LPXTG-site transpeptidase (sortase) family protein